MPTRFQGNLTSGFQKKGSLYLWTDAFGMVANALNVLPKRILHFGKLKFDGLENVIDSSIMSLNAWA